MLSCYQWSAVVVTARLLASSVDDHLALSKRHNVPSHKIVRIDNIEIWSNVRVWTRLIG